ncbi:MAG TPA: OpgC domain-containing protein, partial [Stellaceae bacterium]|nr:OpgC domain-containing protein [Stellaceae bacterium]
DKTNLAPLRLVNFLALALATVYFVGPDAPFLRWRIAWPVILCGQQSLYVFCLGIILAVLGHFLLNEFYGDLPMQIVVDVVGFALMIGTAALISWYRTASHTVSGSSVPATPSE